MNHSYYQQKKERLQEQAKSCYYQLGGKEKAKNYYKDNTERLQKINIKNYLKKKNKQKRKYGRNQYRNMSEEDRQKLRDYHKNYQKVKKKLL